MASKKSGLNSTGVYKPKIEKAVTELADVVREKATEDVISEIKKQAPKASKTAKQIVNDLDIKAKAKVDFDIDDSSLIKEASAAGQKAGEEYVIGYYKGIEEAFKKRKPLTPNIPNNYFAVRNAKKATPEERNMANRAASLIPGNKFSSVYPTSKAEDRNNYLATMKILQEVLGGSNGSVTQMRNFDTTNNIFGKQYNSAIEYANDLISSLEGIMQAQEKVATITTRLGDELKRVEDKIAELNEQKNNILSKAQKTANKKANPSANSEIGSIKTNITGLQDKIKNNIKTNESYKNELMSDYTSEIGSLLVDRVVKSKEYGKWAGWKETDDLGLSIAWEDEVQESIEEILESKELVSKSFIKYSSKVEEDLIGIVESLDVALNRYKGDYQTLSEDIESAIIYNSGDTAKIFEEAKGGGFEIINPKDLGISNDSVGILFKETIDNFLSTYDNVKKNLEEILADYGKPGFSEKWGNETLAILNQSAKDVLNKSENQNEVLSELNISKNSQKRAAEKDKEIQNLEDIKKTIIRLIEQNNNNAQEIRVLRASQRDAIEAAANGLETPKESDVLKESEIEETSKKAKPLIEVGSLLSGKGNRSALSLIRELGNLTADISSSDISNLLTLFSDKRFTDRLPSSKNTKPKDNPFFISDYVIKNRATKNTREKLMQFFEENSSMSNWDSYDWGASSKELSGLANKIYNNPVVKANLVKPEALFKLILDEFDNEIDGSMAKSWQEALGVLVARKLHLSDANTKSGIPSDFLLRDRGFSEDVQRQFKERVTNGELSKILSVNEKDEYSFNSLDGKNIANVENEIRKRFASFMERLLNTSVAKMEDIQNIFSEEGFDVAKIKNMSVEEMGRLGEKLFTSIGLPVEEAINSSEFKDKITDAITNVDYVSASNGSSIMRDRFKKRGSEIIGTLQSGSRLTIDNILKFMDFIDEMTRKASFNIGNSSSEGKQEAIDEAAKLIETKADERLAKRVQQAAKESPLSESYTAENLGLGAQGVPEESKYFTSLKEIVDGLNIRLEKKNELLTKEFDLVRNGLPAESSAFKNLSDAIDKADKNVDNLNKDIKNGKGSSGGGGGGGNAEKFQRQLYNSENVISGLMSQKQIEGVGGYDVSDPDSARVLQNVLKMIPEARKVLSDYTDNLEKAAKLGLSLPISNKTPVTAIKGMMENDLIDIDFNELFRNIILGSIENASSKDFLANATANDKLKKSFAGSIDKMIEKVLLNTSFADSGVGKEYLSSLQSGKDAIGKLSIEGEFDTEAAQKIVRELKEKQADIVNKGFIKTLSEIDKLSSQDSYGTSNDALIKNKLVEINQKIVDGVYENIDEIISDTNNIKQLISSTKVSSPRATNKYSDFAAKYTGTLNLSGFADQKEWNADVEKKIKLVKEFEKAVTDYDKAYEYLVDKLPNDRSLDKGIFQRPNGSGFDISNMSLEEIQNVVDKAKAQAKRVQDQKKRYNEVEQIKKRLLNIDELILDKRVDENAELSEEEKKLLRMADLINKYYEGHLSPDLLKELRESAKDKSFTGQEVRRDNFVSQVTSYIDSNPSLGMNPEALLQFEELAASVKQGNISVSEGIKKYDALRKQFEDTSKSAAALSKNLLRTGKALVRFFMYNRYFRQMVQNVREVDAAMTELRKVTDETEYAYSQFIDRAVKLSQELGASISDVINGTSEFARLGYNLDDSTELARVAIVYKNVGDGISSVNEAASSIVSTMKAFKLEATDAMFIVDKFNAVGKKLPITYYIG